jgi:uncharacterized protein YndB with AHSA1/START domain
MAEANAAREVTITRVFDAPRGLVWKEWTEPGRLARWWGKRGWSTPPEGIEMDIRPGGVFRVTSVSDEDGAEMTTEGVYREVVEPERLAFVEAAEGAWHSGAVTVVTFADLGDGRTEMVFRTTIRTSAEGLDTAAAGFASSFDRLDEHLERWGHHA